MEIREGDIRVSRVSRWPQHGDARCNSVEPLSPRRAAQPLLQLGLLVQCLYDAPCCGCALHDFRSARH